MRRHILLLATLAALVLLSAPANCQGAAAGRLRAGAAKVDITPKETELAVSTDSIRDRLFARAIVVDDGSTCAVLVGLDLGGMANSGYIYSDDAYSHLTFQVIGSRLKPGCAEGRIVSTALDLMHRSGE